MSLDESFQTGLQKTDLGSTLHDESAGHQALAPPPCHRTRRNVVAPADLGHREYWFGRMLNGLTDGRGKIFHEQPEIMLYITAIKHQSRPSVGSEAGDPVTQVIVRVLFGCLDLAEKLLGTLDLLKPAVLRGVPRLLVSELLHPGMAIRLRHPQAPRSSMRHTVRRGPSIIPAKLYEPDATQTKRRHRRESKQTQELRLNLCYHLSYSWVKVIYFLTVQSRSARAGRRPFLLLPGIPQSSPIRRILPEYYDRALSSDR